MGPIPEPQIARARLQISGGKSAYIEPRKSPKICFKHSQSQTPNLTVFKFTSETDSSVHMAFGFELQSVTYFPVVERNSTTNELEIQTVKQTPEEPKNLNKRFLFKWENNGMYGSLCSVAEPSQYLHVSDKKIALSSYPDHAFRVEYLESNNLKVGMRRIQNRIRNRVEEGQKGRVMQRKTMQSVVATRGGRKRCKLSVVEFENY